MDLTFIQTPAFAAKAAKLGLNDEDLQEVERLIMKYPDRGDMMQGTDEEKSEG